MARVKHPLHEDITREVDGRNVSRWVKAGWVEIPLSKEQEKVEEPQSVPVTRSRKTTRKKG